MSYALWKEVFGAYLNCKDQDKSAKLYSLI